MNKIYTLISLLIICTTGMLSQQKPINLWEGKAPDNKAIQVEEFNQDNRISKVTVPQLYHYPVKSKKQKPAIVIIPGGGYVREAIGHEGFMAAEWFNSMGFEAFVLKYRLPDEDLCENSSYVPLMDAQQAIYLVKSKAKEWNIDVNNVGVIGFSAGGHLAASVSTLFMSPVFNERISEEVRPDFSVLMYPVISMDDACTHKGSKENLLGENPSEEIVEYFSLENRVSGQTPITLLIHSIDDGAVPVENSDRYAKNLFNKGGNVTKVILPEGGHGFGFDPKRPVAYWTQYLEVWLKANVIK